ncbi:MAG: transglycosylase domain-containing protein, partial [Bdellovibrionota bacterium]
MKFARIIAVLIALAFLGIAGTAAALVGMSSSLPQIIKVEDYKPLLVTDVFARDGRKIGEYAIEKRTLVPFDKIPVKLVDSFIAAEDDTFYEHGGVNYVAMLRAFVVNIASGKKKQGASTITQQVAKTLLLSSEKTYTRKIKEILLSQRMEENLSKQDILYLYLNQIYFGEGAYGVAAAADTYFRKTLDKLTIGEMALLAGLPQAPSNYSPSDHPQEAKGRQKYVLSRMHSTGKITEAELKTALEEPITVFYSREDRPIAPYFVETLRQMLVGVVGEKALWEGGLKIYTSIDYDAQVAANESVQVGLKQLDKRQGYRGAAKNIVDPAEQTKFLLQSRKRLMAGVAPSRIIMPDGNFQPEKDLTAYHKKDAAGRILTNIPEYIPKGTTIDAIVTKVDDGAGLAEVTFADGQGLL